MTLTPKPSGAETLQSLQILRGLAAWLVVYHHYMQIFHHSSCSTALGKFFVKNGRFGVDIFFVISGFIMFWTIAHRHYAAREFLLRRALRIVPVYWFMTLALIPIIQWCPPPANLPLDWNLSSLVNSLLFIPHLNPSGLGRFPLLTVGWTLNFEVFFYLGLSLVLLCFRRHWFFACTGFLLALPILLWSQSCSYCAILKSNLLYEFAFGLVVAYLFLHARRVEKWRPLVGGLLLLLGIYIYWTGTVHRSLFDFSQVPFLVRAGDLTHHVSAAVIVCAALSFEKCLVYLPASRTLQYLGDISYSTYLVHLISLLILFNLFGPQQSVWSEILVIGAYTALTFALSHLSYQWIETGPAANLLKRVFLARPKTNKANGE